MAAIEYFTVTQLRHSASSCAFSASVQRIQGKFSCQKLPDHFKTPVYLFFQFLSVFIFSSFTAASPKGFGGIGTSF